MLHWLSEVHADSLGHRGATQHKHKVGRYLLSLFLLTGRMSIGGGAYRRRPWPPGLGRASDGHGAGKRSVGGGLAGAAQLDPAPRKQG